MKQIKKLTMLALLGIVSAAALASGMEQASALELRDHQPVHRQHVQLGESESDSESSDSDEENAGQELDVSILTQIEGSRDRSYV